MEMDRRRKAIKTMTTKRYLRPIWPTKGQDDEMIRNDHIIDEVREDSKKVLRSIARARIRTRSIVRNSNVITRSIVNTSILDPTIVRLYDHKSNDHKSDHQSNDHKSDHKSNDHKSSVRNRTNESREIMSMQTRPVTMNRGQRTCIDGMNVPRFHPSNDANHFTIPITSIPSTSFTPSTPVLRSTIPPHLVSTGTTNISRSVIAHDGSNGVRSDRVPVRESRSVNSKHIGKSVSFRRRDGMVWMSKQIQLPVSVCAIGTGTGTGTGSVSSMVRSFESRYSIGRSNASISRESNESIISRESNESSISRESNESSISRESNESIISRESNESSISRESSASSASSIESPHIYRSIQPNQTHFNFPTQSDNVSLKYNFTNYYARSTRANETKENDDSFRFECPECQDVFTGNVHFMNHVYAHRLYTMSRDDRYGDLKTCQQCWREFDEPFQVIDHVEKVHEKRFDTDTTCYICESCFENRSLLQNHMRRNHPTGLDMPYDCKLCKGAYRSSLYVDVWNHFVLHHTNSPALLCPFCLTTIMAKMKRTNTKYRYRYTSCSFVFDTGPYTAHMNEHRERGSRFACQHCKLRFVSSTDLREHLAFQHGRRGEENGYPSGFLGIEWDGFRPLSELESIGVSLSTRQLRKHFNSQIQFSIQDVTCIECGRRMKSRGHFSKRLKCCPRCGFSTRCFVKYRGHVVDHDSRSKSGAFEYQLYPRVREPVVTGGICKCGFTSMLGNELAKHLTLCVRSNDSAKIRDTKQSAYRLARIRESLLDRSSVLESLHLNTTFTVTSRVTRSKYRGVRKETTKRSGRRTFPINGQCNDDSIGSPKRRLLSPDTSAKYSEAMDLAVRDDRKCIKGKHTKISVQTSRPFEWYAELAMQFEVIAQEMHFTFTQAKTFRSKRTSKRKDTRKAIIDQKWT